MDETIAEMRAWALSIQHEAAKFAEALDRMQLDGGCSRMMTVPQLAKQSGVPERTIYAAAKRGDLRSAIPKGCEKGIYVKKEWFEEWIGVGE